MTKTELVELEFYKNGSAESVLKRFVFSEKEEKLVRDAIRTANMNHPRLKLIYEADKLLKEVAKNRQPIEWVYKIHLSLKRTIRINFERTIARTEGI